MENFEVTVMPAGWRFAANGATSLLASAEAAGIVLASSCRNGTCRTCLCTLASGTVSYLVPWPGLSREERREGAILPCVALPCSDLQLTAPLARRAPAGPSD